METYTVVSKFHRKAWGTAHEQTVCTRHPLRFFERLHGYEANHVSMKSSQDEAQAPYKDNQFTKYSSVRASSECLFQSACGCEMT